jgi:hypothetical protein
MRQGREGEREKDRGEKEGGGGGERRKRRVEEEGQETELTFL